MIAVDGFVIYPCRLDGLVCIRMKATKGLAAEDGGGHVIVSGGSPIWSEGIRIDTLDSCYYALEKSARLPFEFHAGFNEAAKRFKELFDELHEHNAKKVAGMAKRLKTEIDLHNAAMKGEIESVSPKTNKK